MQSAKKYDQRQTFSKNELEEMNARAFQIGTAIALYAAQQTLKLGPVRMDRVRRELKVLSLKYVDSNYEGLPLPFDVDEINRYSGKDLEPKGDLQHEPKV